MRFFIDTEFSERGPEHPIQLLARDAKTEGRAEELAMTPASRVLTRATEIE